MKIPRDIGGEDLCKALEKFGYQRTRQTGSHIRLTTLLKGEHHITIPSYQSLRVGTLNAILSAVAIHLPKNKSDLIKELWS